MKKKSNPFQLWYTILLYTTLVLLVGSLVAKGLGFLMASQIMWFVGLVSCAAWLIIRPKSR